MNRGLFSKLAWQNLIKNRRIYVPHIISGLGLTAMFYIILTLCVDERLRQVRGGRFLPDIMQFGVVVIGLLSVILILYTNSFLMKQRQQEFGLYNILGLEKRHVSRILYFETLFSALFAIVGGLLSGVLLYKLCALIICRLLNVDSILGFYHVTPTSLIPTAVFFAALYLFTYCVNRIRIFLMKPVELLQSSHAGEKEPKVKWFFLIVGILTLGAGYYIALTTESPLQSLYLFFIAVILVIIGTYCLFLTGSIALLKLLKRNHRFYYQKKHMVAVSGLIYRMKQNAIGLASIAILSTTVLVMVSTTVSMYAGIGDTLHQQYPHHLTAGGFYVEDDHLANMPGDKVQAMLEETISEYDLDIDFIARQRYLSFTTLRRENELCTDQSMLDMDAVTDMVANLASIFIISSEDYHNLTGKSVSLTGNEVACFTPSFSAAPLPEHFQLFGSEFTITESLPEFPIEMSSYSYVDCYGLVVANDAKLMELYEKQKADYGPAASELTDEIVVDFTDEAAAEAANPALTEAMTQKLFDYSIALSGGNHEGSYRWETIWAGRDSVYGMYGTLLFLGLLLTIVFLFATVLIIYYKQISEGYEDRARFQILRQVGMSTAEIKSTINTQVLLVFFLPLITAGVHIAFAFPILTKLLRILFQSNRMLFLGCTAGAFALFALIYVIIYRLTASVYYHIVK